MLSTTVAALFLAFPLCAVALSSSATTKPVPVTVLSGFLGSGKTSLLQNMLQNKQGLKIGIVVNDVAAVNIDSKLVAREENIEARADGLVQLSNGCACCSLGDELMVSVRQLLTISELRKEKDQFDHIVVEMSGVADPKQVRSKFKEAFENMRMMDRVKLDTMVTLVDSSMFLSHFESTKAASRKEMPELFYQEGGPEQDLASELSKTLDPILVGAVMAGVTAAEEENETNGVADLLVSQTETADLLILTKEDLVEPEEIEKLREIVGALNPRAKIVTSSFGKLPLESVLAVAGGKGIADHDVVDDHRDFTRAVDKTIEVVDDPECSDPGCTDPTHGHSHSHSHDCAEPDCTDSSHSHSHDNACSEPDCTDSSHSHSHDHACSDSDCTDASHSHSQDHACSEPDCTDSSHSHSHSHSTIKTSHEGIDSFVYKARRPFHPARLVSFLRYLPVVRGIPEGSDTEASVTISANAQKVLKATLRSKGFVWCADSHNDALYWSHAGACFELSCLGSWWATLPRAYWPEGTEEYVLPDFDKLDHDDTTNPVGVGDRRQEVVFIGTGFADPISQSEIRDALSQCLLDDKEYAEYKLMQSNEEKLQSRFSRVIEPKAVTY
jgi:G3E family GTPase